MFFIFTNVDVLTKRLAVGMTMRLLQCKRKGMKGVTYQRDQLGVV